MKILVLMSSYNGEKYIVKQIESIFRQTLAKNVRLRIRDDGSTDSTVSVIKSLGGVYPIELVAGENVGYNASFFELLSGIDEDNSYDYYALSDQDDVWLRSKLEAAVKALSSEDGSIPLLYASTSYLVYDDLKIYGQTRRKQRPFTIFNTAIQNICPGHTQVFNGALLKIIQHQQIEPENIYVYDSWITSQAVLYGKILFDNSSFTLYRQHRGNQLGSGAGRLGQMIASIKRDENGDGLKYRRQVEYLVEKNKNELRKQGCYDELRRFIDAGCFAQKVKYLAKSPLYRQNKIETLIFHLAVLSGKY